MEDGDTVGKCWVIVVVDSVVVLLLLLSVWALI